MKTKNVVNAPVEFTVEAVDKQGNKTDVPILSTRAKLIFQVLNRPDDGRAFKYEEIKLLDRVEKAIKNEDKITKEIELELADFNKLKEKLKTMTWPFPKMEYIEFTDYINSL